MKPSASVKSSESCLSAPSSAGSAVSVALSGSRRCGGLRAGEACDPLEDIAAQFLQFAGEAHDVDQRRAQIVADDIGEALDLVVGFAQIGGALVDRTFEIEIIVAQFRFGVVAGARRAPHQKDREAGERDHEARARHRHDRSQLLGAVRGRGAQPEQPIFLGAHRVGDLADLLDGIAGAGLAQHRDAAGGIVAFDEIDVLGEFRRAGSRPAGAAA